MSVYLPKAGKTYAFDFQIRGQRFCGSTGCVTRREAEKFEKLERERAKKAIESGTLKREAGPTVDEVFARYWRAEGHKLSGAKHNVADHLAEAIAILGGDRPYGTLTGDDIAKVLETYEATGVTPATVNRRLARLSRVYTVARDVWELDVRPINWKAHKRKEPKERVRHITRDQARSIINSLPQHILRMVAWSFATGCRLNETETLRWDRVNYDTMQAEVDTKGGGTRFVHLNADALSVLSQCDRGGELVFNARNRRKIWAAALAKAGITDFRWHDMRHTYATWLGRAGADLQMVQKALGHSQIQTTTRYRHVIDADVARVNASMPQLLEGEAIVPLKKRERE
jgi:integrase